MSEKINFKKRYGQNFLTDKNLLSAIVSDAGVESGDTVLEIGAGAGALTEELSKASNSVVAFEIDCELEPILSEKFAGKENVEIIYEDFLNFDAEILTSKFGSYKVVANLPYYITSPIITKLFSLKHRPQNITVMVQKEVGERMTAKEGTENYGYFSALISLYATAKITRNVNRRLFTPVPNVDSCVVRLDIKKEKVDPKFVEFLKLCFKMKRKTLANNLSGEEVKKEDVYKVLKSLGKSESARADSLSVHDLLKVYNALKNK